MRARGAGKKKRKARGWAGGREKGTGRRVALDDVERRGGGGDGGDRAAGLRWETETEQEGNDDGLVLNSDGEAHTESLLVAKTP